MDILHSRCVHHGAVSLYRYSLFDPSFHVSTIWTYVICCVCPASWPSCLANPLICGITCKLLNQNVFLPCLQALLTYAINVDFSHLDLGCGSDGIIAFGKAPTHPAPSLSSVPMVAPDMVPMSGWTQIGPDLRGWSVSHFFRSSAVVPQTDSVTNFVHDRSRKNCYCESAIQADSVTLLALVYEDPKIKVLKTLPLLLIHNDALMQPGLGCWISRARSNGIHGMQGKVINL